MTTSIGIFSLKNDLHALAIQHRLSHSFGAECHIVETNDLASAGSLTWRAGSGSGRHVLRSRDGVLFDTEDLDLVWWRRASYPQVDLPEAIDEQTGRLISNEWKYALVGMLSASFDGVWVNNPGCARAAENKLIQLRAAERAGLRVPQTLISQDPIDVRGFCREYEGRVIVKAVRGLTQVPLLTAPIDVADLDDESIRLCPAIYQECIPGDRHLRLCCFGDEIIAVALESEALDWRPNLHGVPFYRFELEKRLQDQLREVLRSLGLLMGIMDAKLTPDGELVWLEVNPQGQFLFLEGLSGLDLTTPFCEFLMKQAH